MISILDRGVFSNNESTPIEAKAIDLNNLTKKEKKDFSFKYDKFKKITFIHPKKGIYGKRIYPYIAVHDNKNMYLRFKFTYFGKEWLFIKKTTFLIEGGTYDFFPNMTNRDSSWMGIEENSDTAVDLYLFELLEKIADSDEKIEYRTTGGSRNRDASLGKAEQEIIKDVFNLFERLKNQ